MSRRSRLLNVNAPTLIGQRIVAIALGYEDVNDHDTLRRDPVLALFSDQLEPKAGTVGARQSGRLRLQHWEAEAPNAIMGWTLFQPRREQ